MKLAYRLAYFSGGVIIGIIILFFILSGKKTSCAYGPEARTLKHLRLKHRAFSAGALQVFRENDIDTSAISSLLIDGDVIFSESLTHLDSCNQYVIEGAYAERLLKVRVANCDSLATVMEATVIE